MAADSTVMANPALIQIITAIRKNVFHGSVMMNW